MHTWHTEIIALPAEKTTQAELAFALAAAFAEDRLMRDLLGDDAWEEIRQPYFELQLAHADRAVTLTNAEGVIGVLLARSPQARMPGWRSALQAIKVRKLLGDKFVR